ncbi:MAG: metallophosphoesterase [Pseudomonadota bacterium]
MRIAQISDSHISQQHPQRLADLQSAVDAVNERAPDLVLHTGDVAHDATDTEYRQAFEIMASLNAPYFVIPGNRDKREPLGAVFGEHLQYHEGYVQYTIDSYPCRILMLDTVSQNSNKGQLCSTRLEHAISVLNSDDTRPLLVFMHHTPYDVSEIPEPFQFESREAVEQLAAAFVACNTLKAVYCGHVHRNVQSTIGHLPVSAISCMARDLRKGQLSDDDKTRPMYRIIDV